MSSMTMPDGDAQLPADVLVAQAIDRVLASEHAAQQALLECRQECEQRLERAREQRRRILERAQARITALHARAGTTLEAQAARIAQESRARAADSVRQLADPARRRAVLERLACELTSADRHDGL